MEYTLRDLEEFDDDIEFAQWLSQEGFINVDSVECDCCGSEMKLQGNMSFTKLSVVLFHISPSVPSASEPCGWSYIKVL
jgi:hypothetical protein